MREDYVVDAKAAMREVFRNRNSGKNQDEDRAGKICVMAEATSRSGSQQCDATENKEHRGIRNNEEVAKFAA